MQFKKYEKLKANITSFNLYFWQNTQINPAERIR